MKKKFTVIIIAVLAAVCLVFTACPIENDDPILVAGDVWGTPGENTGTFSSTGHGDNTAGQPTGHNLVTVHVELEGGRIVGVVFDLSRQSPEYIRWHPSRIPPHILGTNSFSDIPLDIVRGATHTTMGIIQAGNRALLTVPGVDSDTFADCAITNRPPAATP